MGSVLRPELVYYCITTKQRPQFKPIPATQILHFTILLFSGFRPQQPSIYAMACRQIANKQSRPYTYSRSSVQLELQEACLSPDRTPEISRAAAKQSRFNTRKTNLSCPAEIDTWNGDGIATIRWEKAWRCQTLHAERHRRGDQPTGATVYEPPPALIFRNFNSKIKSPAQQGYCNNPKEARPCWYTYMLT